jgi:hypothetical protein
MIYYKRIETAYPVSWRWRQWISMKILQRNVVCKEYPDKYEENELLCESAKDVSKSFLELGKASTSEIYFGDCISSRNVQKR